MSKIFKFLAAAMIAMFAVGSLTACSTAEAIDMSTVAAVIDVRTPEEVAAGHLHGSLHIDIQGADFASQMNELDKSANYVVYCRSGNRAGAAIDWMTENGFTGTLTNAGSLADAAVVTGMAISQ
jgi:rhodanese-related sulfurtransferase